MQDDGRLELDEDGLPVGSTAGDRVEGAPEPRSRVGRVLDATLTGVPPASTTTRRVASAGLALVLMAVLLQSTRATDPAPTAVDVHGVSARVVPRGDAAAAPRILASYAVRSRPGSAAFRIVGVRGTGVAASVATPSSDGTQSFLVDPDCGPLLEPSAGTSYELLLSSGGPTATSVVAFDGADALTRTAVRACWAAEATKGLRAISVTARPGRETWTALDVVLGNRSRVAMSVTAVDVADVDTLAMADSRDIEPGSTATVHVRLPIARCSRGTAPTVLNWTVGRPGDAPTAFATTALTPSQSATVASAARARCGPPPRVSVRVLSATTARDRLPADARGVSITFHVRVSSSAPGPTQFGDDTRELTSDARPVFSGFTIQPGSSPRDLEVVWHTRCGSSTTSALPVTTSFGGLRYWWTVPLTGASLPALRAVACT